MTTNRTSRLLAKALLPVAALLAVSACDVPDRTSKPLQVSVTKPRESGTYGRQPNQRYELHTPSNWKRTDRRTLVLYAHGGGWSSGTTSDIEPLIRSLTSKGHVVLSVGYTHSIPVESQVAQLRSAATWAQANAGRFGVNPSRLFVAGHSAGAHLMTMLSVTWGSGNPIRGAIAVAPPLNLADPAFNPSIFGIQVHYFISQANSCPTVPCSPDILARLSPVNYVDAQDPPVYVVSGDLDPFGPVGHARALESAYASATGNNERVWVDVVEGGDHYPGSRANTEYLEHFIALNAGN